MDGQTVEGFFLGLFSGAHDASPEWWMIGVIAGVGAGSLVTRTTFQKKPIGSLDVSWFSPDSSGFAWETKFTPILWWAYITNSVSVEHKMTFGPASGLKVSYRKSASLEKPPELIFC